MGNTGNTEDPGNTNRITVRCFRVGMLPTNCYVCRREDSAQCLVVDPGDSGRELFEMLEKEGISVAAILLTHAHYDHILGVAALKERSGAPVFALDAEEPLCSDPMLNHSGLYGMGVRVCPDRWLRDNEEFTAAGITLRVIATPGHTVGSCCYYAEEAEILFSGDTLFCESVGRTDLPTGSMSALTDSIRGRLFLLPDETEVFPGHEGFTTIGHEKKYNCFV